VTERHTRQGLSLGQKHGTLDREDQDLGPGHPWAWGGGQAASERAAASKPERRLRVISGGGCWCGRSTDHTWPGRGEGEPHPDTFHAALQAAAERSAREMAAKIEVACEQAARQGIGVLVLTRRGVPWKCGPWHEVPAGEVQWRVT